MKKFFTEFINENIKPFFFWLFVLFLSLWFSNASLDYTLLGSNNLSLPSISSATNVDAFNFIFYVTKPFSLISLSWVNAAWQTIVPQDTFSLFSSTWLILQTWSNTKISLPIRIDFDSGVVYPPWYYWILWKFQTNHVNLRFSNSSVVWNNTSLIWFFAWSAFVTGYSNYYLVPTTTNLYLFSSIFIKQYDYISTNDPITINYWNNSFQTTWTVYVTGWDYARNGQNISYAWLTGVNIHWVSSSNGWTWIDHYELTDFFLSGAYEKSYTWWWSNFWLMSPSCSAPSSWSTFTWYQLTFTWSAIVSSWTVWNSFSLFGFDLVKVIYSNIPSILWLISVVILILFIINLVFKRKRF